MRNDNQEEAGNKLSMTLSVFIALCLVSVFCAISIVIVENIEILSHSNQLKMVHLPHHRDFTDLLIL